MSPLAWASLLLLVGVALAALEVFIPSGGVIGFLSVVSALAAIVLAFRQSSTCGVGFMGVAVIILPIALVTALHFWPRTPMGRRLLLRIPTGDDVLPDSDERRSLKALVGAVGQAKTLMLPGGMIAIGDRSVDAVSEGMAIEPGQAVKVVEVRGTRVVVRPTDEAPGMRDPDSELWRPIDTLGLEDPLA